MKKIDVVLGLQWGDEGKGKVVDVLTPNYQVIARFQGGPNAGHSLHFEGKKYVLHTIPSGIFRPEVTEPLGIKEPVLAWGLGIDRMALMHLGLSDLRDLFTPDIESVRTRRGN